MRLFLIIFLYICLTPSCCIMTNTVHTTGYTEITQKHPGLITYTEENIHPGFSVDCVIISFHKKKLLVLLSKFDCGELWQLPGGFMLRDESANETAYRVLTTRTGLTDVFLNQFHLFSNPERTKMEQNKRLLEAGLGSSWLLQRFVSLGYYALVKHEHIQLAKIRGEATRWFDIQKLPPLYSDHEFIIQTALGNIRNLLPILPVGHELLSGKFTLGELRKIYEIILNKTIDRRNFKRKVLASGLIVQLDEHKTTSTYNPATLYAFAGSRESMSGNVLLHELSTGLHRQERRQAAW